jgi:hypothetical protein
MLIQSGEVNEEKVPASLHSKKPPPRNEDANMILRSEPVYGI